MDDEHRPFLGHLRWERVGMAAPTVHLGGRSDPGAALARLHQAEATMAAELSALREAIAQIESTLAAPPASSSGRWCSFRR
ncbi:MAG: hypothetical protein ACYC1D_00830 [Acidimicrobiales bacterium]